MGPLMTADALPEARGWDRLRRPVWLFDNIAKRHLYANDAALVLWGAESREEFLNRDCSDQSEAVKARTQRLLDDTANGEVVSERWTFYPLGEPTPAKVLASTFRLPCGRAVIQMEAEALEVDADQMRSLEALRHAPAAICLFRQDGGALFRNPVAYATFGPGDLRLDKRYENLSAAEALMADAWAGAPASRLLKARTLHGERWMHTTAHRVTDPVTGGAALLWASQDVTPQVEAEMSLIKAAERAETAEARERRLTNLSHEMRTPLNAILGFAEILMRETTCLQQTDRLQRMTAAGQELDALVNGMLAEGEAESGGTPTSHPVPMSEVALAEPDRRLRILYADDHENNRMVVSAMLGALGWACDTVNDGAEAVARVQNGDYDLVLMDIQMPVMDGIDAARAIRSLDGEVARTPIVALTANTLEAQLRRYRAAGMQDCLSKPIAMTELLQTVMAWSHGSLAVEMGERLDQRHG